MSRANLSITTAIISYSDIFWDENDGQYCFYIKLKAARGPTLPEYRIWNPVKSNVEYDKKAALGVFPERSEVVVLFDEKISQNCYWSNADEKIKILAIGKRGEDRWARLWNGAFPPKYQMKSFINCDIRPDSLKIY